MHVLVIAASDSDGANLSDRSGAWTELVRQGLESRSGEPVTLTYRRLYVHAKGWRDYFEQALTESKPDLVIVGVNGVSWAFRTVPIRVRKLFGNRAGDWVERRQQRMDRGAKANPLVAHAADFVHWSVRRCIPAGSYLPRAEAERRWLTVIDRIAREEDAHGVVLNKTNMHGQLLRAWPEVNVEVAAHNAVLKQRTLERHLTWFDREAILAEMGESAALLDDRVHRQPEFHKRMAASLLEALAANEPVAAR